MFICLCRVGNTACVCVVICLCWGTATLYCLSPVCGAFPASVDFSFFSPQVDSIFYPSIFFHSSSVLCHSLFILTFSPACHFLFPLLSCSASWSIWSSFFTSSLSVWIATIVHQQKFGRSKVYGIFLLTSMGPNKITGFYWLKTSISYRIFLSFVFQFIFSCFHSPPTRPSSAHRLLLWPASHCWRCNHHSCGGPNIKQGLCCDLDKLRWDVFASLREKNTGLDTWSWIRRKERGRGTEGKYSLSEEDGECVVFLNLSYCGCCREDVSHVNVVSHKVLTE